MDRSRPGLHRTRLTFKVPPFVPDTTHCFTTYENNSCRLRNTQTVVNCTVLHK